MDEKPKSIWKKSWTGRSAVLIWALLIALAIFLAIFISALANFDLPLLDFFGPLAFVGIIAVVGCFFVIYLVIPILRWLFWNHWRRTLFCLACLATLIALFYAEEDWRGLHDWNKFEREWEAKGEHFDYASVVPPRVPDDQNFAMAPIWVESIKATLGPKNSRQWFGDNYAENGRTNFIDRLDLDIVRNNDWGNEPTNGYWAKATITDLAAWQAYYRAPVETNRNSTITTNDFPIAPQMQTPAQDVLLALSKYDSAIEELRQASELPYSRFPLNYDEEGPDGILLPHLGMFRRISLVLQLRAIAELQNGQSEKAFADVKLALRLADSVRTEPFVITHLVRIVIVDIALQPVYEGLAEHKWSDAQLAGLDAELSKPDFLADWQNVQKSEIFFSAKEADYLRRHRDYANVFSQMGISYPHNYKFEFAVYRYMPGGWFYQSALKNARMLMNYSPAVNEDAKTISPALTRQADLATRNAVSFFDPLDSLKKMFGDDEFWFMGNFLEKIAFGQTSLDLARTAVALERYRLAHGEFPESLDALAPQFIAQLPHDVIGGEPLKYHRADNGQFILYSVGWNEKDDGGVTGHRKGSTVADFESGDWVWRYPAK